jgi:tetratricopeptide (TPR) repeat protein
VHFGLGGAGQIDKLEVRWLGGPTEVWTNLKANRIWDLTQGDSAARLLGAASAAPAKLDRETLVKFWAKQRAAMDALKREGNHAAAVALFREALALNPGHEDSHYYLANSLAALGDITGALVELDELARVDPHSHRAFQRKGELQAAAAAGAEGFRQSRESLNAALRINSEETGTLILLGEVALALREYGVAEQHLAHACQANSRAANAFFFRGYGAWKQGDASRAAALLAAAAKARGPDWKPRGAVHEGDVRQRMFRESGFLTVFEQRWDGAPAPERAFREMDAYLEARRR